MSKQKLTPWFDGRVKPARLGVYERKMSHLTGRWSRWDGKCWLISSCIKERAAEADGSQTSVDQSAKWRGLAADPAKGKK